MDTVTQTGRRSSADLHVLDALEQQFTLSGSLAVWGSGVRVPLAPLFGHLGVPTRTAEVDESRAVPKIQAQVASARMIGRVVEYNLC